jgi:hypothetical protein
MDYCKESRKKKCIEEFFISKLQNGGLNQDGISNHCIFLLAVIRQPILKCKFIFRNKHYNLSWSKKKIIQNKVQTKKQWLLTPS